MRTRCWVAGLLTVMTTLPALGAQAAGGMETLLPDTTKGFVSVTNVQQLVDHWKQTQLGQLVQDPVMEPFRKDVRRQFQDRWSSFQEKLGLTLDDLKDVPSGEVCVAVIQPDSESIAVIVLADVTGNGPQAEALLEKVSKNLTGRGAKRTLVDVPDVTVVQFDLPKKEEDEPPRRVVYFLHDNLLGVSNDPSVIQGILGQMAGAQGDTLADVAAFKAAIERCQKDAGQTVPHIRWFIEPFGYIEALRTTVPERERRKGRTMLDTLKSQGFSAIGGIGGFVSLSVDGYELVHRTMIFAPTPYEKSMKMLVFPNGTDFTPQAWVPRDVATYSSGYVDLLNAFDSFGSLFDELFGAGETGVWIDVLEGLEKDPNGPQINLRKELIEKLGNRITVVSDYQLPITTTSERLVFAIEVKGQKAVAAAIEKLLKDDEGVRKRVFEGHVIWETIPEEKPAVPAISLDAIPLLPGEEPDDEEKEEEEEAPALLPNAAVTVADGQLLVASDLDFLLKILQRPDEARDTLGGSVDYRLVEATAQEFGVGENCVRVFSRTDEEYRPTYELIRQGKMPESETILGRLLNTLFGAGEKGVLRQQEIDGSKLPEFEVVRRYLGTAGTFGSSEASGWFFKGFILGKESQ